MRKPKQYGSAVFIVGCERTGGKEREAVTSANGSMMSSKIGQEEGEKQPCTFRVRPGGSLSLQGIDLRCSKEGQYYQKGTKWETMKTNNLVAGSELSEI